MAGGEIMWIYILTGAICCFIGVLTEKYSNKNRDENFDSLLKNIGDLNRELYEKNNELFEAKGVIKELESKNIGLKNLLEKTGADVSEYTVEGYDLSKLEQVNNHLRTENAGLIKKNKNLKNSASQIKKQNKKLKKENKKLLESKANPVLIERYKNEINNLHQVIACKNELIRKLEKETDDNG